MILTSVCISIRISQFNWNYYYSKSNHIDFIYFYLYFFKYTRKKQLNVSIHFYFHRSSNIFLYTHTLHDDCPDIIIIFLNSGCPESFDGCDPYEKQKLDWILVLMEVFSFSVQSSDTIMFTQSDNGSRNIQYFVIIKIREER